MQSTVPSKQIATCDPNAPRITVNGSLQAIAGLAYSATSARYTLTWKTDATWAGTSRTVVFTLAEWDDALAALPVPVARERRESRGKRPIGRFPPRRFRIGRGRER